MSREARLRKIEDGQQASSIETIVGPYIQQKITEQVKLLVSHWRADTLPHDKMVGIIGGISALEAMMSDLRSIQQQAWTASEKEFGDGKET